jgi:DNA mismatch repair protein MutS
MSTTQEYLDLYTNYKKQYGDHTILLYMVGSFYEMYSVKGIGPNLFELSKLLNIQDTHKDKGKPESVTNPHTLGFQMNSLEKFLEILTNNDFTAIVYDQKVTLNPTAKKAEDRKKVTRFQNGIYTKSTFITNLRQNNNNYLMCIYIVNEEQKNSKPLRSVGLSCVDLSTKQIFVHSAFSSKYDEYIALDDTSRFISNVNPSEVLIYYDNQSKKDNDYTKDALCGYLSIDPDKCRYYETIDPKYKKIGFQNEFLRKVYPSSESLMSPIEQLDLETELNITVSLCLLFDFVHDKLPSLLKNIKEPEFCFDTAHLMMGNNAIYQLDIFENQQNSIGKLKYKSLFNVVNFCRTSMGERYLRNMLASPSTSKTRLNKIYDYVDKMQAWNIPKEIRTNLDAIKDIERLARKIELKMIKPYELPLFVSSYENIIEIINVLKDTKDFNNIIKNDELLKEIKEFITYMNKIFDVDNLSKCTDTSFEKQVEIYNKGIHKDIDDLNNDINSGTNSIETLRDVLFELFPKTKSKYGNGNGKGKVMVKRNDTDGYYLKLTDKNAKILQKILEDTKTLSVGSKKIKTSDLEFSYSKNNAKITIPSLNKHADSLEQYTENLTKLYKSFYSQDVELINEQFGDLFLKINEMVTKIDYYNSGATLAMQFGYCRPELCDSQSGTLEIKELRHPIIERIIDYEYVPHDVKMNDDMKIMMLYGLNSSGKSSLMKSIAISTIMAQAGLFVSASSFKTSIFKNLMCRISANDNLQRGLSSFSMEMGEINSILKRSDSDTLVICDEILKSTEHISGVSLVAATLMKLDKLKCISVVTTHMHELMNLDEIKAIKKLKAYHIHVSYDIETDALVYDRKLCDGSGQSLYGIEVGKYMIKDTEFIDDAVNIKNKLLEQHDSMVSGKTSHFNNDVYMHECSICQTQNHLLFSNLQTHHIIEQQKFSKNKTTNTKLGVKKDDASNLIVLCEDCHHKIHNNQIKNIEGYVKTSKGKKIVYEKK